MRIKKDRLLIGLFVWLGFAGQNAAAQDDSSYTNPLKDMAIALPADSIPSDSTTLKTDSVPPNPNAIDAPIHYASKDSMIMELDGHNMIYMFGEASVQYKNLDLTGEYIEVNADSSLVYATFAVDSIGEEFGYPVFKEGESQYEMKKARYNFKSKKMYITDVITEQGEGYVTAERTKKMSNDDLYMLNGKYTTCDDHEHPHFYLNLTKAKVRPGKNIVTGPAYLVVEDVPLPVAIPFGFFPFTSDYSSGVIMPTYGDELRRGFSLQNGGYYFAFSDHVDMALTGQIFTRGSWGLDARSTYRKRYKFSGSFQASYLITVTGDKGDADYSKSKDLKLSWSHSQDPKANPFSTLSGSVNFSTSSYDRNELNSLYSNQYTQNSKSSSVNYAYRPPGSPFSFSANATINQISKDTTLSLTLPNFTLTMRDIYPFQRKEQIGSPKWYENIRMSYTGLISNSIQNVKEYDFFKKNLVKDWRNGMKHTIPVSASFNLFKNITITPSANYEERWYTNKINQRYDQEKKRAVAADTVYGFYRIYNYSASVSAQTKLYGMYQPWGVFGEWTKKTQIRHVMTPNISFSGAPDFGSKKYGYYQDLVYYNTDEQRADTINYSPYSQNIWSVPGRGKSGALSFSLDNNLEMKIPIAGTDSTRKISLIDQLRLSMGYNFLADSLNWSDLSLGLRLKLPGNYTLSLQGMFDTYTYAYNEARKSVVKMNKPRWEAGQFPRLRSTGTTFSYSFNNETLKKLFGKGDKKGDSNADSMGETDIEQADAVAVDENRDSAPRTSLRQAKAKDTNYDDDGYYMVNIPWNLNFNYSWSLGYGVFEPEKLEYKYQVTQTLGLSGSISPTKGWSFNFNTSYDFDRGKFATMQCSIVRQMHCWSMSASVIPIGPYQSYNFTIAVSSSLLQDLKYNQSSNYRDTQQWGN
jgi:hypothetical protein